MNDKNIFGRIVSAMTGHDEPKNHEELLEILQDAEKNKVVKHDAVEMIKGALAVSEKRVEDVMVVRSHMVILDMNTPFDELLSIIVESGHSRFPVIDKHLDDVKGLLLAKDILRFFVRHKDQDFNVQQLLRPIVSVPERKRLDLALKEFRLNQTHLALVADEHGSISGLITIEDILEQIVGAIEDEHDLEEEDVERIRKASNSHYLIDGLTEIDEFNAFFNTSLKSQNFDTIGGLVAHELGHVPKKGESCEVGDFTLLVSQADDRRATQLSLHLPRK